MNELRTILSTDEGAALADAIVDDLVERDLERQHAEVGSGKTTFGAFGDNGVSSQN